MRSIVLLTFRNQVDKDARNATKSPQSATCADLLGEDVYGRHQAIYSIVVTPTIAIHGTKIGV